MNGFVLSRRRFPGAGLLRTFWHIALPLAIPGFVVVLIRQSANAWNDFLFAVFFSSPANGPVTLALNYPADVSRVEPRLGDVL